MIENGPSATLQEHGHVFLAADHARSERKTWTVIALCGVMMVAEIVGGLLFGSIALVADGLHMSTHAGALLLAAMAYSFARKHAKDARFSFGTGKVGDLAGFTSAIVLAMIALLIGYESISRLFQPVAIHFAEAIPIATVGLAVNLASAWLLSHGSRHHHYDHEHDSPEHDEVADRHGTHEASGALRVARHEHASRSHRDNNMRSAIVHVAADAMVSVLVIVGLVLARVFGWLWMDPLAGIVGAAVIASWSYGLVRDTGAVLLDVIPDRKLADSLRQTIESEGDLLADLHLWRVGPGHLAAIVSVITSRQREQDFYRKRLGRYKVLSHLTVEVVKGTL